MRIDKFFKTIEAANAYLDENKIEDVVVVEYYDYYESEFGYLIVSPDEVDAVKKESDRNWELGNHPTRADYE